MSNVFFESRLPRHWKLFPGMLILVALAAGRMSLAADEVSGAPRDGQPGDLAAAAVEASKEKAEVEHVKWISDLAEAQKIARAENKDLLLFFTGSDWCVHCKRLEKAVLKTPEFAEWISKKYVPVLLDFPGQTELPPQLAEQNDKLKTGLGVNGFPSVYLTEVNVLPYGKINGFAEFPAYLKELNTIWQRSETIRAIKGDREVAAISKPETLDHVITSVPEELWPYGWTAQINRIAVSNVPGSDEFKTKWLVRIEEMQKKAAEQELVANANSAFRKLKKDQAPREDVLAFLDSGLSESAGHPPLAQYYRFAKIRYLQESGTGDQAVELLKQFLADPQLSTEERDGLRRSQTNVFLSTGRIEEGLALIVEAEAQKKYPSEKVRQEALLAAQAADLVQAKQYSAALPYFKKLFDAPDPESEAVKKSCMMAEMACFETGSERELHGHVLLYATRFLQSPQPVRNSRARQAAIFFRAADRPDLAELALDLIVPENEPPLATEAETSEQTKLRQAWEQKQLAVKAAQGSQGDALKFLSTRGKPTTPRAICLMDAAFALRKENRAEEANRLAQLASEIAKQVDANLSDRATTEHLQRLLKEWSVERL